MDQQGLLDVLLDDVLGLFLFWSLVVHLEILYHTVTSQLVLQGFKLGKKSDTPSSVLVRRLDHPEVVGITLQALGYLLLDSGLELLYQLLVLDLDGKASSVNAEPPP